MEENFVRLLLAHPRSFGNRITRVAQLLAESTIEVNDAFIDTKLLVKLTMINVYSTIEDSSKQVNQISLDSFSILLQSGQSDQQANPR